MVRMTLFSSAVAALAAVVMPMVAAETELEKRIVVNPKIVYPTAGTTWAVGDHVNVTWDVSHLPPQAKNMTGTLRLGYISGSSTNEHLSNTLADKFLLRQGNVTFTVPDVSSRDDYVVVLMGDSGNKSPKFAIHSE